MRFLSSTHLHHIRDCWQPLDEARLWALKPFIAEQGMEGTKKLFDVGRINLYYHPKRSMYSSKFLQRSKIKFTLSRNEVKKLKRCAYTYFPKIDIPIWDFSHQIFSCPDFAIIFLKHCKFLYTHSSPGSHSKKSVVF